MVVLGDAEIVFLALPYGKSKEYLDSIQGKKIIDLSIDHRFSDGWTYGLPEVYSKEISQAKKVANPGCYATSIILGAYALRHKLEKVSITSISGISGAGLAPGDDNFLVYNEREDHPQIVEIQKALGVEVQFTPIRADSVDRGIVSVINAQVNGDIGDFNAFYAGKPFIRIKKVEEVIETKNVVGTNFCDLKILVAENKIKLISSLDNIVKGGAGQAVQNFNLMYGLEETTGLLQKL